MTLTASVLAVATAFIGLWTLRFTFDRQRRGDYTQGTHILQDSTAHT